MSVSKNASPSPAWGSTTKLVVGLTMVTIVGALLIRFNNFIGPLILAFVLSYLLHPIADRLSDATRLSWRATVNLIYLVFLILLIAAIAGMGVAVVQQAEALTEVVGTFFADLPDLLQELTTNTYIVELGPWSWQFDLSQLTSNLNIDILSLSNQILSITQPLLGQAGGLLGRVATSAAGTLGWAAFVLVISYFVLADAQRFPGLLQNIDLPGHDEDIRRIGRELARRWHAFLRGQLTLVLIAIFLYFILMNILGVNNALVLALLAGFGRLVPYLGPFVADGTAALVAFFQGSNYLGLEPWAHVIVVVVAAIILDQVIDQIISPRLLGATLGIHPAAVLVSAFILSNLIGLLGLLLAAPVLASLLLIGRYIMRKMLDLDPWPKPEEKQEDTELPFMPHLRRIWQRIRTWMKKDNANE